MNEVYQGPGQGSLLWADNTRCIGCFACEAACKMEHDLPPGPRPIRVIQIGPLECAGELVMYFQPVTCNHCSMPACVAVCPTGAMRKHEDNVVRSDPELCIGCQTCAVACPFGVPQLNPATGKIAKCDGCFERVKKGLTPACVAACPTRALSFATPEIIGLERKEKMALLFRRVRAF